MSLTGIVITFVIMWWMAFLALLPVGVKGLHEHPDARKLPPAVERAAPVRPNVSRKAIVAVPIAAVVTLLVHLAVANDLASLLPMPPSQRAVVAG